LQQAVGFDDRAAGALASANYAGYLLGALLLTIVPIGSARAPVSRVAALRFSLIASIATTAAMAATQSLAAWARCASCRGSRAPGLVLATAIVHAILSRAAGSTARHSLRGRRDRHRAVGRRHRPGARSRLAAGWLLLAALSLVIMVQPGSACASRRRRRPRRHKPLRAPSRSACRRGAWSSPISAKASVHCHRHIPRRLRALDADPRALGGASMDRGRAGGGTGRRAVGRAGSAWAACRR